MDKPLKTVRYMNQFRCIGPDCEDHCCRAWTIHLGKSDYDNLEKETRERPEMRARFEEGVALRGSEERTASKHARLDFGQSEECSFLEDRLCVIHRDLGEKLLPGACATYPRILTETPNAFVLTGSISCPEVARLCLLQPHALEEINADWEQLPEKIQFKWRLATTDSHVPDVRSILISIMDLPDITIKNKLYLVLYYAKKINPSYLRAGAQSAIQRHSRRFCDNAFLEKILQTSHVSTYPDLKLIQLLFLILGARMAHSRRKKYNNLVFEVLESFPGLDKNLVRNSKMPEPEQLEVVWEQYNHHCGILSERLRNCLAPPLLNFCRNFILQEPFMADPGPEAQAVKLTLHLSAIKFLILNHPSALSPKMNNEDLNALAVRVSQIYMRNISHNSLLFGQLLETMRDHKITRVSDLIGLLGPW